MDINKIRNDFPMLKNNLKMQGHNLIYFDNAATSLKPTCVLNAIKEYYETYTSNSHRGDYDLEYKVDVKIDETRKNVAKLIKILQFLNEYLLEQRQIINNQLISLEKEGNKLQNDQQYLDSVLIKQKDYLNKLRQDAKIRH